MTKANNGISLFHDILNVFPFSICQSNKRFKPAEEGENVNVPTPEVDRGRLDPTNFTAVVQVQEHDSETGHFGDKS